MLAKVRQKMVSRRLPERKSEATITLVRKLLSQTVTGNPAKGSAVLAKDDSAVLFACEIDGIRCTLQKTEPPQIIGVGLSPREFEIARMIAKGLPNKTIAGVLDISIWTVSTHLRRVFAKLGVCSRAAMVAKIADRGALNSHSRERPGPAGGTPGKMFKQLSGRSPED